MPRDSSPATATATQGPLSAYAALHGAGDLIRDAAQLRAAGKLQHLHEALRAYRPRSRLSLWSRRPAAAPRGLYLHGAVGRGKSMLMDMFFESAPLDGKRRVHFHAFMMEVHDRMHAWRRDGNGVEDPIGRFADETAAAARLLCFDEFHVEDIADAMILGRLFAALFERGVVIVATSNTAPADLYRNGLQRELFLPFIDLIGERLDVVELDGPVDYRRERLRDMRRYFTPLGPEADAALSAAFARLTDGAAGARGALTVKGRTLDVPTCALGVARFSFDDLCERPLGAADYLAIAHAFHTVILAGVPQLPPGRRAAARRFVNLIDVLYDNRVALIAAAAAPPDALYPEGDGADAFRRAVSRLLEMQGADYLARSPDPNA